MSDAQTPGQAGAIAGRAHAGAGRAWDRPPALLTRHPGSGNWPHM